MSGDNHAAPHNSSPVNRQHEGLRRGWVKALLAWLPWRQDRRLREMADQLVEIDRGRDNNAHRLDELENEFRQIQGLLKQLHDDLHKALQTADHRLDELEDSHRDVGAEIERIRDHAVPAAVRRSDVLLERLAEELEEVASLVERSLRGEPLPAPGSSAIDESRLAEGLAKVQPQLLESFRGTEEEIHHRLDHYLPDLQNATSVLDLGCGRGELLLMLREVGVGASGVEGDAALVVAAQRRGLEVIEGDVLEVLKTQPDAAWGVVTGIHLFEHLPPVTLLSILTEIRRVLEPGGRLLAECPNPHSLRVGASLFWQDPTHQRPLLPETLELFLRATGFVVGSVEYVHPFPDNQLLSADELELEEGASPQLIALNERVNSLRRRLDEIINGSRDFAIWAEIPS